MRKELFTPIYNSAISGRVSYEDAEQLRFYFTAEEAATAIRLCRDLLEYTDIEDIIFCAEHSVESFCQSFLISSEMFDNWKTHGMTEFERDTIIFELIIEDFLYNRLHQCLDCNNFFFAPADHDDICPDCADMDA